MAAAFPMPQHPARQCAYPGCATLVRDGSRRCEKHPAQSWAHHGAESRHARGYGTAWDKLRLQILRRDGYRCRCNDCATSRALISANEVDHIVSKAEWMRRHGNLEGCDNPSNLQAINRDCHKRKTALELDRNPRARIGVSGWPIEDDTS